MICDLDNRLQPVTQERVMISSSCIPSAGLGAPWLQIGLPYQQEQDRCTPHHRRQWTQRRQHTGSSGRKECNAPHHRQQWTQRRQHTAGTGSVMDRCTPHHRQQWTQGRQRTSSQAAVDAMRATHSRGRFCDKQMHTTSQATVDAKMGNGHFMGIARLKQG